LNMAHEQAAKRVAAIDVGSNSLKLTVGDVSQNGTITVIDQHRVHVQLGGPVTRSGCVGSETIARVVAGVQELVDRARGEGADGIAIVGTSAVREAADSSALLAAVCEATGLTIRILTGHEEAMLTLRALEGTPGTDACVLGLIDVGGGSTEVAVVRTGNVECVASIPVGAVRLKELHGTGSRLDEIQQKILTAEIDAAIDVHLPATLPTPDVVFATGGTVTALAMIDAMGMPLDASELIAVEGRCVSLDTISTLTDRLAAWSASERMKHAGISMARAEVLVPGACILRQVLRRLHAHECRVSEQGLRGGLLRQLAFD
jgi:exopolyphosphatase/guanosine-5'-triphosphate,3'-diphosphate pyrophosphatase